MSSLKQNIRSVLADVEIFLVETLKSVKLNSGAKDHKDRLLEKIKQLLDEIPGSASSQPESNISGGSGSGTSSGNLQGLADDESGYADNVTKVAVSDLKNKLQTGMLDKKKKSGFKTWEPLYCVVSGNVFYMYKKQTDSKQKEAFCLSGYEFHEAPGLEKDTTKKDMCFEVTKAGAPTYQFRAGSKEGMVIWKEAITKGIQIAAEEDPGELYEDVGQESESGGNLPPPPPCFEEDPEEIYEECGAGGAVEAEPPPPPPPNVKLPPPPPHQPELATEAPDEVYDDCASAVEQTKAVEKSEPPAPPPGRRRDPPPVPASDPPPPPPPKADLPPIPTFLPPPIPDRRPSNSDAPPLPSNPPPLPGRSGSRVPQLRKPFMDRDEDFENVYYGKWASAAQSSKELAFQQGDMIHVLSRDFDAESWWVGELDGKVGLVPKEYLCPAFELVP